MTTIAVIPARYASTRFPGKPLAKETGKYLIRHVYESVSRCSKIDRVIVATDDERIMDAVRSFGGSARMTRADHTSGTNRVGEVGEALMGEASLAPDDLVLNVQGDEPEISPAVLERLIDAMNDETQKHTSAETKKNTNAKGVQSVVRNACRIGTLAAPFADDGPREGPGSPLDPNCVKVVVDENGRAMYFSRSPIPYPHLTGGAVDRPSRWLLHLGVYAFRADVLRAITAEGGPVGRAPPDGGFVGRAPPDEMLECRVAPDLQGHPSLAETESLEQLRWLERGLPIAVVAVDRAFVGIDTPEDYASFVKRKCSVTPCG